jgi:3'-5' exoribonuclease
MSDAISLAASLISIDPVPNLLPSAFRVTSLTRVPMPVGMGVHNEATLYHDQAGLRVTWVSRQVDTRIQVGCLVSIRWRGKTQSEQGAIVISRLVRLERVEPGLNLFQTVPPNWVRDRALVVRTQGLWNSLSRPFRHLVNAIFWEGKRFHRFLTGPASLKGHHNGLNGNFRHAVETAEQALSLARVIPNVSLSVLVTAALLHDAGKADEYRLRADRQGFVLSDRGVLVGHRHTILEWIAVARAKDRVILPDAHYLALLHALTAAKGAEWLGIRQPVSLEATLLSTADRLSGQSDLIGRMAPNGAGFGQYHEHLKGRPYVVGEIEEERVV